MAGLATRRGAPARLLHEVTSSLRKAPEGIDFGISNGNPPLKWEAVLEGPQGTPYEGGKFRVSFEVPHDYPFKPPSKMHFKTKVYHPLVKTSGRAAGNTAAPRVGDDLSAGLDNIASLMEGLRSIFDMTTTEYLINGPPRCGILSNDIYDLWCDDRQTFWNKAEEYGPSKDLSSNARHSLQKLRSSASLIASNHTSIKDTMMSCQTLSYQASLFSGHHATHCALHPRAFC